MNLLLLVALAVCIAACGGKSSSEKDAEENKAESVTLKTEVQGSNINEYASFPDEVKIKLSDEQNADKEGSEKESIVNLILPISLDVKKAVCSNYDFVFKLSVVDQDYVELFNISKCRFERKIDLNNDYSSYLERGIVRQSVKFTCTAQEWETILNKGASLIVKDYFNTSDYKEYNSDSNSRSNDEESSSSTDDDNSYSSSDSDSEDWDSILDSYERCVDKYIALAKKAADGDASAISEYTEFLKEAQELSEKLSSEKGSLSSSQMSRYTKISQKMASAAQQMK